MSDPTTYPREEHVEDTRYAAETLESVHPNPYSGHGGRVLFHSGNSAEAHRLQPLVADIFLPETDGTELRPDERLTAERFEQMGRTADAGVVLALGGKNN